VKQRLALLIALTLLVYLPFIGGGFVTDDYVHIAHLQNQRLTTVLLSPDAFGYHRPISQASLFANLEIAGSEPWVFRAANLLTQAAVLGAALVLARLLLGSMNAAFLAAAAFALTPKAHPVAVLWISARPELLMSLFALLAVICWIHWDRGGGRWWCVAAFGFYLLAIGSKEAAALLPLLLLLTPPVSNYLSRPRVLAVVLMIGLGTATLALRGAVGARLPFPDLHYDLLAPVGRDLDNARNYLVRALPAPALLVFGIWVAWLMSGRPRGQPRSVIPLRQIAVFAMAWFVVFIAPVLPLAARSELYLYVTGFGFCVLAASISQVLSVIWTARTAVAALVLVGGLAGYQVLRAAAARDIARFSEMFSRALIESRDLHDYSGVLVIQPEDPLTESRLRGSVSGYLNAVLAVSLGRTDINGLVIYRGMTAPGADLRLTCASRGPDVVLFKATAEPARAH
jgi:hypothetical protein